MAVCAACGSTNKDDRTACDICNAPLPGRGLPVPDLRPAAQRRPAGAPFDRFPGELPAGPPPTSGPPSGGYAGPGVVPSGPAGYAGPPPPRGNRPVVVVAVAAVAVALVAVGALVLRPSSDGDPVAGAPTTVGPTTTIGGLSGVVSSTTTTAAPAPTIPGWTTFSPLDGAFRVQFPTAAKTWDSNTGPMPGLRGGHTVAAGNQRFGYTFVWGELMYPVGDDQLPGYVAGIIGGLGKSMPTVPGTPVTVDGLPGYRWDWDERGYPFSAAVVLDGTRVYVFMAAAESSTGYDMERFLSSFHRGPVPTGAA